MSSPKDRVTLRLYNTIAIFDVYTVAHDGLAARDAILEAITSGDCKPVEVTATEVSYVNAIRGSWLDEKPYVASDVTDEEFDQVLKEFSHDPRAMAIELEIRIMEKNT